MARKSFQEFRQQNKEEALEKRIIESAKLPETEKDRRYIVRQITEDEYGNPIIRNVDYLLTKEEFLQWLIEYATEDAWADFYLDPPQKTWDAIDRFLEGNSSDGLVDIQDLNEAIPLLFMKAGWPVQEGGRGHFIFKEKRYYCGFSYSLFIHSERIGAIIIDSQGDELRSKKIRKACKETLKYEETLRFIIVLRGDGVTLYTAVGEYDRFVFPTRDNYQETLDVADYNYEKLKKEAEKKQSEIDEKTDQLIEENNELKKQAAESKRGMMSSDGFQALFGMFKSQLDKVEENLSVKMDSFHEDDKAERKRYHAENVERFNNIDTELQEIAAKLDSFIAGSKEMASSLLEQITKEDDIERIVSQYADIVVGKVNQSIRAQAASSSYNSNEELLKEAFAYCWINGKMDEKSKKSLISARILYDLLSPIKDKADYSGVCLLTIKALERELQKRFYHPFLDYLDKQNNGNLSFRQYPRGLKTFDDQGNPTRVTEKDFTFGAIATLLGNSDFDSETRENVKKEKQNGYGYLRDYCMQVLFCDEYKQYRRIQEYLKHLVSDVVFLKDNYRNPAAHVSRIISVADADKCFEIIVTGEKILKEFLDHCRE